MKSFLCTVFSVALSFSSLWADEAKPVFELRTYHAAEGKLEALQSRFRDHTVKLFAKHGMTNVGYWLPVENEDDLLVYLLRYPSQEARENSWNAFLADEDWQAAYQASTESGKLVDKIDSVFLAKTDFSADFVEAGEEARLFEMRTYTTADGMLPSLHKRFRDHTCTLFAKHGMTNLAYFEVLGEQANADNLLIYFLAHKDAESAKASWNGFRQDPDWRAAAKASEANGKILVKGGVKSVYLKATDFSPVK